MLNIKNKRVTIIGAKKSGIALARLVSGLGGKPKISEGRSIIELGSELEELQGLQALEYFHFELGGNSREFIEDSDIVVLSPGVRFDADVVRFAMEKGICVLGEIEFAAQFCNKPIIAVTGSNGKTTVVTLITKVIEAAGMKACLCGNVGSPFSEHVLHLDDIDYVVLEVSSFQMESLIPASSSFRDENVISDISVKGFKPFISVILNFSQNHLDRHKDLYEYFNAKTRVCLNQDRHDHAVINFQDHMLAKFALKLDANLIYFNKEDDKGKNPNHLAVKAVAKILGIDMEVCNGVFGKFGGVEHRMEKVRDIDGVDYINDSKATTVESGRWALNILNRPVVMICGGKDKGSDYTVLKDLVSKKVKKMIVIGAARDLINNAFSGSVDIELIEKLEDAVLRSREIAKSGDCVLLSPMCASFDQFDNFEHRGKVFKELVNKL
ncbi:MAG: hypothetical protein A2306_09455 [Omnitrophica WOR_2 bacterium RIFOXYB2_FULL_38_16]|nr:MAG: hypothetical protein A2243_08345 [Omnitrophica WOR_2 bacterium RIFOXYA2_FULL_38_17]OGX60462.1 MAG: hypothetical protein A2306_09455 [Omnitrophica WOR_2 bacterium RIFOXYB2_FULL_38_16]HBG60860.1 hypothetical protein [Candidatus Omnitrophota bacterium]